MERNQELMATIRLETFIAAPIERVFNLARSIEVHMAGSEHTGERVVSGRRSGLIEVGDTVTWEARHLGVKQMLTSEVVKVIPNELFEDIMLKGAFASMRHTHLFTEVSGGTLMVDKFHFTAPLGLLGRLAECLFLTAYMRRYLWRKNAKLKELAESSDWREWLEGD